MRRLKNIKILIVLVVVVLVPCLSFVSYGASIPSPTSAFYVNDFANILNSETEQYIISAAKELENKTKAQIVIVTMSDIGDDVIENYSIDLFNKWGIGSKDKDNGLLIFLDLKNSLSRIEVGYGLEGALPDSKTAIIQRQYMIPYFKQGDFNQGVRQGFNALLVEVYREYGIDYEEVSGVETPVAPEQNSIPPIVFIIGAIALVIFIIIDFKVSGGVFTFFLLRSLSRGGGKGGGSNRGGGGRAGGGGSTMKW